LFELARSRKRSFHSCSFWHARRKRIPSCNHRKHSKPATCYIAFRLSDDQIGAKLVCSVQGAVSR
jgi:hypothetical protein